MMNILSIDPATESGWAFSVGSEDAKIKFGSFQIPPKQLKWIWFMERIKFLIKLSKPDVIVVEMPVIKHVGATIHHAKLVGIIQLLGQMENISVVEVPPNMVKKFATGKGNADKEQMLEAARRLVGYDGSNHNTADAILILLFHQNYIKNV